MTLFYLLSETERCFILKNYQMLLLYIHLWLTIDAGLLVYFDNTTVFLPVKFFVVIIPENSV